MINDKRMKFVKSEAGMDYYIFTPTLFRQYYNKTEEWTAHRKSVTHKLHMLLYFIRGGYRILYLMDGEKIGGYLAYTHCGRTVIAGSDKNDIYTIFVTTHPDYRKRGLATRIVNELLHGIGLKYNTSYKTIADTNIGSQKAAYANGYEFQYFAKKSKIFKTITKTEMKGSGLYACRSGKRKS